MENKLNFTALLLFGFIMLKLMHFIDWSWWWVLSPFWIPIVLFLLVKILFLVIPKPKIIEKPVVRKSAFMKRIDDAIEAIEKKKRG